MPVTQQELEANIAHEIRLYVAYVYAMGVKFRPGLLARKIWNSLVINMRIAAAEEGVIHLGPVLVFEFKREASSLNLVIAQDDQYVPQNSLPADGDARKFILAELEANIRPWVKTGLVIGEADRFGDVAQVFLKTIREALRHLFLKNRRLFIEDVGEVALVSDVRGSFVSLDPVFAGYLGLKAFMRGQ